MLLNWQFKHWFIEKDRAFGGLKSRLSSRKRLFLDPAKIHLLTQVHEQEF